MTNLGIGTKVLFRNGETCTIKDIRTNEDTYKTCTAQFQTIEVKANTLETIVLEFEDGGITLAGRNEFEII